MAPHIPPWIGLVVHTAFAVARLAAFGWALRRVLRDRFLLGVVAILLGGALAGLSLLPQGRVLVDCAIGYAGAVVALGVVPLVVAWRREHHAAHGLEDEQRAERIVRDVLPLVLLDALRLGLVLLEAWMLAD